MNMTEMTEEQEAILNFSRKIRHEAMCTADSAAMIRFWHEYLLQVPGGEKYKLSDDTLEKLDQAIGLFDDIARDAMMRLRDGETGPEADE